MFVSFPSISFLSTIEMSVPSWALVTLFSDTFRMSPPSPPNIKASDMR